MIDVLQELFLSNCKSRSYGLDDDLIDEDELDAELDALEAEMASEPATQEEVPDYLTDLPVPSRGRTEAERDDGAPSAAVGGDNKLSVVQ